MTPQTPRAPDPAPVTDVFRDWVRDSLAALDLSAVALGRRLDLGHNTIGDFLKSPGRNIRLDTAHGITCELRSLAAERDVTLPRLRVCLRRPECANG